MGIPPTELRALTSRIVRQGAPAYLMAVAGNADPMLGYLTTSFRQHPELRRETATAATVAMDRRLAALSVMPDQPAALGNVELLYCHYRRSTGDQRSTETLTTEARRKIGDLQDRGFDLALDEAVANGRADRLYEHARRALYSTISESVLRDACPVRAEVQSRAIDRDDFIAHPAAGERITDADRAAVRQLPSGQRGAVQIVVSDGLNADAINEQLRHILPPLRRVLTDASHQAAEVIVVVRNGRVRAGYDVAAVLDPLVLIHIIGERPGTGLNTASAYLTYGRDDAGRSRWDSQLDHSQTTAVCGIHKHGKQPDAAAAEIGRTVRRMVEQRRSGVRLG
jgi:ethanolamine ammonia-lyase small subunit